MNNKKRTKVKFQVFEHEDDSKLVDFTLELTDFPRENLFDFLITISNPFAEYRPTPPDEAT